MKLQLKPKRQGVKMEVDEFLFLVFFVIYLVAPVSIVSHFYKKVEEGMSPAPRWLGMAFGYGTGTLCFTTPFALLYLGANFYLALASYWILTGASIPLLLWSRKLPKGRPARRRARLDWARQFDTC